jgi:hypothetical protein
VPPPAPVIALPVRQAPVPVVMNPEPPATIEKPRPTPPAERPKPAPVKERADRQQSRSLRYSTAPGAVPVTHTRPATAATNPAPLSTPPAVSPEPLEPRTPVTTAPAIPSTHTPVTHTRRASEPGRADINQK